MNRHPTLRDRLGRWIVAACHRTEARLGIRPRPAVVQLQTTSMCNGRCGFCPHKTSWGSSNPGVMSEALFDRIVADLAGYRLDKLCMYLQNEPLLDPDFMERLGTVISSLKCGVLEVSTNASQLDQIVSEALAETLRGVRHEIWVSFHGVSRDTYEPTMGLDFDRALRNVVGLLGCAEEHDLRVVLRGAGRYLAEEDKFLFSRAEYEDFWRGVVEKEGISSAPRVEYFSYHDRAGNAPHEGGHGTRRLHLRGFYCWRIDRALHVLYNGDVIICCNDYRREVVLGNLQEQSIAEVLSSSRYRQVRRQAMGLVDSPAAFICKRCARPGG